MVLATFGGFFERLNWPAALWGGLWAGLVAFTIGLSFLLWTRWGNYHLTGKCILFSLLAHVILGLFLATAEVVEDVVVALNTPDTNSPITTEHVHLTNSTDESTSHSSIDGSTDESPAPAVWDRVGFTVAGTRRTGDAAGIAA